MNKPFVVIGSTREEILGVLNRLSQYPRGSRPRVAQVILKGPTAAESAGVTVQLKPPLLLDVVDDCIVAAAEKWPEHISTKRRIR